MQKSRFTPGLAVALVLSLVSVAPALAWSFPTGRWGHDKDSPRTATVGVAESQGGNQAMTGCTSGGPLFIFNISQRAVFDDVATASGLYMVMTLDPMQGGRTLSAPAVAGFLESGFLPVSIPDEQQIRAFRKAVATAHGEFTLGVVIGKPAANWTQDSNTRNVATLSARGSSAAIAEVSRTC